MWEDIERRIEMTKKDIIRILNLLEADKQDKVV